MKYDGKLFKNKKVNEFLTKIDETCFSSLQSFFLEFKDHSYPIVSTPTMLEFTAQAPAIFGDIWDLLYELRGMLPKQKEEKLEHTAHTFGLLRNDCNVVEGQLQETEVLGVHTQYV